ncbi:hypothetical protein NDU88_004284 [Pleurodeles waltl]|uniref:Uncharacterized protein n=1 Tax=Pleurodeles waltl TaxID=8319 RepID=A0AAV7LL79_PLEWA|nr:hypothetical protein NDU88_004284 [Pleurodeles waltl]
MPGTATSTGAPVAFNRAPMGFLVPASVGRAGGQRPDFWAAPGRAAPRSRLLGCPGAATAHRPAGSPGQLLSAPGSSTSRRRSVSGPATSPRPGPESQRSQRHSSAGASDGPVRRPRGPQFLVGIRA